MKNAMKGALLLVPIVILAGLSLMHEYNRSTGTLWTIPVAGYDPRDMLRGQYLQFQYEWNIAPATTEACAGEGCALCTDDASAFNPQVRIVPVATAPAACASFIAVTAGRVDPGDGIFIDGARGNLTRYYVPERHAARLQGLLTDATAAPDFSVGLRVTDEGTAFIDVMYVDGVPLEEWLNSDEERD